MSEPTRYENPIVLVACYVCVGERILWIRRGIPPAAGKWGLPGGFMEKGETPEQAACRELLEETSVRADPDDMTLVSVTTVLHMVETHLAFRCHLDEIPDASPTEEATEIAWFNEHDMPWPELAFRTVEPQVHQMYEWLQTGRFGIRVGFADEGSSHYKSYLLAE